MRHFLDVLDLAGGESEMQLMHVNPKLCIKETLRRLNEQISVARRASGQTFP